MAKGRKANRLLGGDRGQLGEYVRDMANEMGLRDWTIVMKPGEPEEPGHGACIQIVFGRRVANIWFRKDWSLWPADELRGTVTHELVHCHTSPLAHTTINNVAPLIGKKPYLVAWEAMNVQLESATDAIAEAWAATLPLPIKAKDAA